MYSNYRRFKSVLHSDPDPEMCALLSALGALNSSGFWPCFCLFSMALDVFSPTLNISSNTIVFWPLHSCLLNVFYLIISLYCFGFKISQLSLHQFLWIMFLPLPIGSHKPASIGNSLFQPPHFFLQFSSVTQSCPTLCSPMDCITPGLPVHNQLPEFTQTHVHWVCDAIQPLILCRPLLLQPSIFPSIRVFSNESVLCIR